MNPWAFHIGSCALKAFPFYLWSFNIFNTMADRPSDFMIWTGDHVYMLKPWQWRSEESMRTAYLHQRKTPQLRKYMASRPQLAIWDDHDYGPNNSGAEFKNKDTALKVFREMWPQQAAASDKGVYFSFFHKEVQFFMLDGRYFKIPEKQLLGEEQFQWLCKELKASTAPFKIICIGVQVLSDAPYENFRSYPSEFDRFMKYIDENKIEGILFMSGDVHFAEVSKIERKNAYPLYDFTFSPLTSFATNIFAKNSHRLGDTKRDKNNFGEVSFSGDASNRKCTITCFGREGKKFWNYQIDANDLTYPK